MRVFSFFSSYFHFTRTFQKHNLLSSAQETYGKRECQLNPPKSFNGATNNGSSDFKCDTINVTSGRPMLATICSEFGEYFIARPPSSCSIFVSVGRLEEAEKRMMKNSMKLFKFEKNRKIVYKLTKDIVNQIQSLRQHLMP